MLKCIHSDVCNEYNRRYHKKLNEKCSHKCKFYMRDGSVTSYSNAKDKVVLTAKQVGDIVSDAILDAYLARHSEYEETKYYE